MTDIFTPAVHTRKKKIIVFDTETTGLLPYDRIITLGAVKIEGDELLTQSLYLIFDPRKDSSPQAEAVHGFDNWMTRYQDYLPIWQVHCGNGSAGQTSWWLTTLNLICVIFNGNSAKPKFRCSTSRSIAQWMAPDGSGEANPPSWTIVFPKSVYRVWEFAMGLWKMLI
ncbi:exonuclease family protein [Brucella grignonensis]|uniref:Exonuclease family protein n=1 Tax=Brucella grignonensis TaxID=94627 RepID=A0A256FQM0_9HYPH|nr:exonuclease family protein [Brucella grignonensis]